MDMVMAGGLFLAFLAGLAGLYFFLKKELEKLKQSRNGDETLVEWLKSTQRSADEKSKADREALARLNQSVAKLLQDNAGIVNQALTRSTRAMNERLDKAARYMSEVAKEVGQMSEIGRSMKELQQFLNSPKLRGNIGEEVLKDLIGQMFPKNSFHLQYSFKSGEKVDAAIKTTAGILPIDSKFPMENFNKMMNGKGEERKRYKKAFMRDVRSHVRAISKKYILPEEGTLDFSLMYIPSESVFYEVVNIPELITYAREQRVYPVSPSTLYAHLQTILLSFEGQKIEEKSKEVFRTLRAVRRDYVKIEDSIGVLGKHIGNAYSKLGEVNQSVSRMGQKLSAVNNPAPIESGDRTNPE